MLPFYKDVFKGDSPDNFHGCRLSLLEGLENPPNKIVRQKRILS